MMWSKSELQVYSEDHRNLTRTDGRDSDFTIASELTLERLDDCEWRHWPSCRGRGGQADRFHDAGSLALASDSESAAAEVQKFGPAARRA